MGRGILLVAFALGAIGSIAGLMTSERFWFSFLQNSLFVLTLALGAVLFVAFKSVSNAGWATALRRVPEAMMGYVPIGGILLLLVFFGRYQLYPWTNPVPSAHEAGLQLGFKHAWLSTPFFFGRMIVFLAVWSGLIYLMRRASFQQDSDGDVVHTKRRKAYSAIFIVVFGVTFSLASFDWIMSIEPMFYSTIFGFYTISGTLTSSAAAITILVIFLKKRGFLPAVGEKHMHALGQIVMGFATFWAYMWISQYLLIYYANLPEETIYYYRRTSSSGWMAVFILNLFLNWVIPFVMLLPRQVKMNAKWMVAACTIVLAGHWLDLYAMIFPAFFGSPIIGFVDVALTIGFVALFLLVFIKCIGCEELIPRNDPYLEESVEHEDLELVYQLRTETAGDI
ncbi:MAG: polysulfide reductase NrfD [Acidobacteria bacterium OLB17]|nr:MAG: polysulfide reductase NrfD [Acidobacteria bacterium OLB17]